MRTSVDTRPLERIAALLQGAPSELTQKNAKSAYRIGNAAINRIVRQIRSAAQTTDFSTVTRTGRLRASYGHEVKQTSNGVEMDFGVIKARDGKVLEYARVHEHNGETVIRAKNGKFLAIPLDAAKTAKGVARGGPRDYPDTFVRSFGGSPMIVQQIGNGRILPLFVLKRSVRVKGRPAVRPVAEQFVQPSLIDAARKNYATLLQPGSGEA